MNSIYIYHHLGLGDHIACNGIVRHYADLYDKVFVFSKSSNIKNILTMYHDDPKIKVIAMDDGEVKTFMAINQNNNYLIVGHEKLTHIMNTQRNQKLFDEIMYELAEVPIEYKWEKFKYQRNLVREKEVYYDILGLTDDSEFIFIHESNYDPVNKQIPKNIQIIRPDNKDVGIFDYLYTISKAKEVHVMNSSFMNLIDCIQLRNDNLYYHEYARPNINAVLRLPWNVIK